VAVALSTRAGSPEYLQRIFDHSSPPKTTALDLVGISYSIVNDMAVKSK
jgi:hypothetical protein